MENERIFRRIALDVLCCVLSVRKESVRTISLVLDTIRADAPDVPGEGLLLVGHGTIHQSQAMYSAFCI